MKQKPRKSEGSAVECVGSVKKSRLLQHVLNVLKCAEVRQVCEELSDGELQVVGGE